MATALALVQQAVVLATVAATVAATAVVSGAPLLRLRSLSPRLRPFQCGALLTATAQEAPRSLLEAQSVVSEALAWVYSLVPASATEEDWEVVLEPALDTESPSLVPPSP